LTDETRGAAIRRVMKMKSWNFKTAAAFVDEQLAKIQKQLDRSKAARRLLIPRDEERVAAFCDEKMKDLNG
jgi:hypothetical protein